MTRNHAINEAKNNTNRNTIKNKKKQNFDIKMSKPEEKRTVMYTYNHEQYFSFNQFLWHSRTTR